MARRSSVGRFTVILLLVVLDVPAAHAVQLNNPEAPAGYALSGTPSPNLRIVGPAGEDPPVVNERKKLKLHVINASGSTVRAVEWRTVDAAVGRISKRGALKGVKFGVMTIRATTESGDIAQTTAVVARVRQPGDTAARGDSRPDSGGNIYLSDPDRHVIYKSTGVVDSVFAGSRGEAGFRDGMGMDARFNVPSGLGIDVRAEGALFVADTGNNVVRAVGFNGRVRLAAGNVAGLPGTMTTDTTPLDTAAFRNPGGVASLGPNIFVADTGSHAIYFVDFAAGLVHLVAGSPGEAGYAEGEGRTARFDAPAALAINSAGNLLAVADVANDRVRLVRLVPKPGGGFSGVVSTAGVASKSGDRAPGGGYAFDAPSALGFDVADNLYVTSAGRAEVVTRSVDGVESRVLLAQTGSLVAPRNLSVRGTEVFVLDRRSEGGSRINIVDVGPPEIASATPDIIRITGGEQIVIRGRNFPPETRLVLGDAAPASVQVVNSTEIRFVAPPQISAGARSLTVRTRGGVAQAIVQVKPLGLADVDPGDIVTVAGGAIPYVGDGGVVGDANAVIEPRDLKMDAAGNLYFADAAAHRIRRVDAITKVLTTIAGTGRAGFSGDGGPAVAADLSGPTGVALDASGNVYLSDTENSRVRRVDAATGTITTVIGTGVSESSENPAPGSEFSIGNPAAMVVTPDGTLFVNGNNYSSQEVVRYSAANDTAARIAVVRIDGQTHGERELPLGGSSMVCGPDRALYIAQYGFGAYVIRVDPTTGAQTIVAGNGGLEFDGDGRTALETAFRTEGIAFDSNGNLLVSSHDRVRRIDVVSRLVTTVAGNGTDGIPKPDELAVNTGFGGANNLVVDGSGDIVVVVTPIRGGLGPTRLWRVEKETGIVVAEGARLDSQSIEFLATSVRFELDVAVGVSGTSLIIGVGNEQQVYGVDLTSGILSRVAGGGTQTGDNIPADSALLYPRSVLALETGIAIASGRVYLLDPQTRILRVIAGSGEPGSSGDGGPATEARLSAYQLAADSSDNLTISDLSNFTVRRVDAVNGLISTVAGNGSPVSSGDGGPAIDAGVSPVSIAVAPDGTLYILDRPVLHPLEKSIRRVDPVSGIISKVASLEASALAVDASGRLYAAIHGYIVRIDVATGEVIAIAGTGEPGSTGDGGPALEARIGYVTGLAIGTDGTIYFDNSTSDAVRAIKAAAAAK